MIYLSGVTLGHFNLYPVGFQPKDEQSRTAEPAVFARLRKIIGDFLGSGKKV